MGLKRGRTLHWAACVVNVTNNARGTGSLVTLNVRVAYSTLGTRGFSRVRREFSVLAEGRSHLAETGNRARKDSGTQGMRTAKPLFKLCIIMKRF